MIFPFKVPNTISADISKYVGPVFNRAPSQDYISQKKIELECNADGLSFTQEDGYDFVKLLASYCEFTETPQIEEVALHLEEDITILHQGILNSICFCFPSGFVPTKKIGIK